MLGYTGANTALRIVKMNDIESQVLAFIREERPDLTIHADTELMDAGVLDSIALIKAIQFMEATFGITIPDSDIDPSIFSTPKAVADYIARRRGGQAAAARPPETVAAE
jgi:acyl carrier protein